MSLVVLKPNQLVPAGTGETALAAVNFGRQKAIVELPLSKLLKDLGTGGDGGGCATEK